MTQGSVNSLQHCHRRLIQHTSNRSSNIYSLGKYDSQESTKKLKSGKMHLFTFFKCLCIYTLEMYI